MPNHKWPIRVLLVEDDLDIAASLGDYLERHGLAVDYAYGVAQARARVRDAAFDVFVVDVNLPGGDGYGLCRCFKEELGLSQPVLFLTARGSLDDKLRGFAAGGVDYVVKPYAPAELLARIRALAALAPAKRGARLQRGDYELDLHGRVLRRGEACLPLTASAYAILRRLMEAYPGCVGRDELCETLWGGEPPDSEPLRAHVHQLRRQLLDSFGQPLIATLRGVGYRFEAAP